MGKDLGLSTLAEGVETPEQLAFLEKEHCDLGQGYYFARPLKADALEHALVSYAQPTSLAS